MAREQIDLKVVLRSQRFEHDILQKIPCSAKENRMCEELLKSGGTLPKGVYAYEYDSGTSVNEFYTIYEADLTENELKEYLAYKQLALLHTIKNCVVFFTVLTVIGIVAGLFLMSGAFI